VETKVFGGAARGGAEKGSIPFLSYSRSSVILHICYGESFLVPAGAGCVVA